MTLYHRSDWVQPPLRYREGLPTTLADKLESDNLVEEVRAIQMPIHTGAGLSNKGPVYNVHHKDTVSTIDSLQAINGIHVPGSSILHDVKEIGKRNHSKIYVDSSILEEEPQIGRFAQGNLHISPDYMSWEERQSVDEEDIQVAISLIQEQIDRSKETSRVGVGYHVGKSSRMNMIGGLAESVFSVEESQQWRKYNPRRNFHRENWASNYEVKSPQGEIVGEQVEEMLVCYDETNSPLTTVTEPSPVRREGVKLANSADYTSLQLDSDIILKGLYSR